MKKFLFLLTIAALLLASYCNAFAEDTRICPSCGAEAVGNYCSECGHACGASLPELEAHEAFLSIKVIYEKNIVFAKYDVEIRVDGKSIGTVKQTETLEKIIAVKQGVHEITLQGGETIEKSILIDVVQEGSLFSCTIKAHTNSLELTGVTNSSPASAEAAMDYRINKEYGSCSNVDYKLICRYPERYANEPIHINGVVVSSSEGFFDTMKAVVQDKKNNLWLIQYKRHDDDPRLLVNDSVDIYGHYNGIGSHLYATETWLQLPTLELEYLLIH